MMNLFGLSYDTKLKLTLASTCIAGAILALSGIMSMLGNVHYVARSNMRMSEIEKTKEIWGNNYDKYALACLDAKKALEKSSRYSLVATYLGGFVMLISMYGIDVCSARKQKEKTAQPSPGTLPHDPAGRSDVQG